MPEDEQVEDESKPDFVKRQKFQGLQKIEVAESTNFSTKVS